MADSEYKDVIGMSEVDSHEEHAPFSRINTLIQEAGNISINHYYQKESAVLELNYFNGLEGCVQYPTVQEEVEKATQALADGGCIIFEYQTHVLRDSICHSIAFDQELIGVNKYIVELPLYNLDDEQLTVNGILNKLNELKTSSCIIFTEAFRSQTTGKRGWLQSIVLSPLLSELIKTLKEMHSILFFVILECDLQRCLNNKNDIAHYKFDFKKLFKERYNINADKLNGLIQFSTRRVGSNVINIFQDLENIVDEFGEVKPNIDIAFNIKDLCNSSIKRYILFVAAYFVDISFEEYKAILTVLFDEVENSNALKTQWSAEADELLEQCGLEIRIDNRRNRIAFIDDFNSVKCKDFLKKNYAIWLDSSVKILLKKDFNDSSLSLAVFECYISLVLTVFDFDVQFYCKDFLNDKLEEIEELYTSKLQNNTNSRTKYRVVHRFCYLLYRLHEVETIRGKIYSFLNSTANEIEGNKCFIPILVTLQMKYNISIEPLVKILLSSNNPRRVAIAYTIISELIVIDQYFIEDLLGWICCWKDINGGVNSALLSNSTIILYLILRFENSLTPHRNTQPSILIESVLADDSTFSQRIKLIIDLFFYEEMDGVFKYWNIESIEPIRVISELFWQLNFIKEDTRSRSVKKKFYIKCLDSLGRISKKRIINNLALLRKLYNTQPYKDKETKNLYISKRGDSIVFILNHLKR